MADLNDVRDFLADEHGLAVVSTTQADGRVLSSVVNCGVIAHPLTGEDTALWQASDLNSAWRHVFMALVRQQPDYPDDARAEASLAQWNRLMGVLEAQLAATDAYVAGSTFTLADIVLGLSTQRWRSTPGSKPALPHLVAWFERLREQPGFAEHVDNGVA